MPADALPCTARQGRGDPASVGRPAAGKTNPELDFHDVLVDGDLYCCRLPV